MKYIKSINEGWLDKILPKTPKPVWVEIKELSEIIFNQYLRKFRDIENIEIDTTEHNINNTCFIKINTTTLNEYGTEISYIFSIKSKDDTLVFKTYSYNGMNIDNFKSFKRYIYPLHDRDDIEKIIKLFASKLEPFIKEMLELDK